VYKVAPVRDWDQAKFQLIRGQKDLEAVRYDRFVDCSLMPPLQHSQIADSSLLENSEINNQINHIEDKI
jgi:hypothetical protein